jgi:hypothetical protein
MKKKRENLESEITRLLEERKAENDALKKLIAALHEEEMRRKTAKTNYGESSQIKNV